MFLEGLIDIHISSVKINIFIFFCYAIKLKNAYFRIMYKSLGFDYRCTKCWGPQTFSQRFFVRKKKSSFCVKILLLHNYFKKGLFMLYDIIKLLNLEDYNIDISSAYVIKDNDIFYLHLKLNKLINYTCQNCGCICSTTHDYVKKKIKHGLFLNNELIIIYYARRIKCNDCGKSFFETNPFSHKFDSISHYTKFMVLDALRDFHSTYTSVANLYHLSKNQIINIFDEHVDCSPKELSLAMNFDEFYLGKKSKQKYAFVITNHLTGEIIDILPSRKKEYLTRYFDSIPKIVRNNVQFICIDMYETYKDVATSRFPKALIAVDSFHVIQHINQALIELRAFIMNKFDKKKSKLVYNDMYYYMLKKFHYFFVKDYDKIYNGYINIPKMKTKL